MSICELLQSIFPPGGNRVHRLNCCMFVIFNFLAKNEASHLFHQVTTNKGESHLLLEAYRRVLERDPHGCLILDLRSHSTPERPLRVRVNTLDHVVKELWNVA